MSDSDSMISDSDYSGSYDSDDSTSRQRRQHQAQGQQQHPGDDFDDPYGEDSIEGGEGVISGSEDESRQSSYDDDGSGSYDQEGDPYGDDSIEGGSRHSQERSYSDEGSTMREDGQDEGTYGSQQSESQYYSEEGSHSRRSYEGGEDPYGDDSIEGAAEHSQEGSYSDEGSRMKEEDGQDEGTYGSQRSGSQRSDDRYSDEGSHSRQSYDEEGHSYGDGSFEGEAEHSEEGSFADEGSTGREEDVQDEGSYSEGSLEGGAQHSEGYSDEGSSGRQSLDAEEGTYGDGSIQGDAEHSQEGSFADDGSISQDDAGSLDSKGSLHSEGSAPQADGGEKEHSEEIEAGSRRHGNEHEDSDSDEEVAHVISKGEINESQEGIDSDEDAEYGKSARVTEKGSFEEGSASSKDKSIISNSSTRYDSEGSVSRSNGSDEGEGNFEGLHNGLDDDDFSPTQLSPIEGSPPSDEENKEKQSDSEKVEQNEEGRAASPTGSAGGSHGSDSEPSESDDDADATAKDAHLSDSEEEKAHRSDSSQPSSAKAGSDVKQETKVDQESSVSSDERSEDSSKHEDHNEDDVDSSREGSNDSSHSSTEEGGSQELLEGGDDSVSEEEAAASDKSDDDDEEKEFGFGGLFEYGGSPNANDIVDNVKDGGTSKNDADKIENKANETSSTEELQEPKNQKGLTKEREKSEKRRSSQQTRDSTTRDDRQKDDSSSESHDDKKRKTKKPKQQKSSSTEAERSNGSSSSEGSTKSESSRDDASEQSEGSEESSSGESIEGGDSDDSTDKTGNFSLDSKTKAKSSNKKESDDDQSSSSSSTSDDDPTSSKFVGRRKGTVTDVYFIQDLIEKGEFANVYSAAHKETGEIRAAKEMKKSEENEAHNKLVVHEFELLKGLTHPNLIKVYELFENEKYYFLVTVFWKGTTLRDTLMSSGLLTEKKAALIMKQALSCFDYIHKKGIVHRDIKPTSILLEAEDDKRIRIIDFGQGSRCGDDEKLSDPVGTVAYMAPEVLGMSYGTKCDIWSLGVVLYLVLSGHQPFKGATHEETFNLIVNGQYSFSDPIWENISWDAKHLIKELLTWEESTRPAAKDALKHPWIKSGGTSRVIKPPETKPLKEEKKKDTKKKPEEPDARSKLILATCSYVVIKALSKEEQTKVENGFDTNAGVKLTKGIVGEQYRHLFGDELAEKEAQEILDGTGGGIGAIAYAMFIFGALDKRGALSKTALFSLFTVFEKDSSHCISFQEFREFLKDDLSLDKKTVKKIVSDADKNDGRNIISFYDFLTLAGLSQTVAKRIIPEVKETERKSDSEEAKSSESDSSQSEESSQSIGIDVKANLFVSRRLGKLTEHYEILEYIAKGSYGVVCSALHKATGTIRAVKELKKSKKNQAQNELMLKEYHILKALDHPNILQMHELFEDKRHYYIITGVSRGGDLHRELKKRGSFKPQDTAVLMKQVLICVNYFHKKGIVHRDLKPGNILLEEHKKLNHIKIIDFGESVIVEPGKKLNQIAGTLAYMAPEVIGMNYAHKCDLWSCGVITYLLLTGKQPFKGKSDEETFSNIAEGVASYSDPVWNQIPEEAQGFVRSLLTWEDSKRPSAAEALEHPWIKSVSDWETAHIRQSTMKALSNLESFDAQSKLKVATVSFIATQLMDKKEKEKIDDVFRAIDLNNDGTLNREEVKYGYGKFFGRDLSDEEIDAIFKHVDAGGTGELEYSQFLFGALDKQDLLTSENLKKAFSIFDLDGSGDISMDELKELLREALTQDPSVDEKALNKMIAQVDKDGDGKVSYEEFVSMALGAPVDPDAETEIEEKKADHAADPAVPVLPGDSTDDSRHLQKAIARTSEIENRSKRDPPTLRYGRIDPPTGKDAADVAESELMPRFGAANASSNLPSALPTEPVNTRVLLNSLSPSKSNPHATLKLRRKSAKLSKIDEACAGFERIQEKLARLRILLSVKKENFDPVQSEHPRPSKQKRSSNVETLDSAFAKLGQIQDKMKTLQTFVKTNQEKLRVRSKATA